jgi:hypothetical protein
VTKNLWWVLSVIISFGGTVAGAVIPDSPKSSSACTSRPQVTNCPKLVAHRSTYFVQLRRGKFLRTVLDGAIIKR